MIQGEMSYVRDLEAIGTVSIIFVLIFSCLIFLKL